MDETARDLRVDTDTGVPLVLTVHPAGRDGAMPVLLLHGLSQQRRFWDPVVRRMRVRPVAAMDQRGHGETDTPLDADFSIAACAADVMRALDALAWDSVVVVGHSWGASVALAAAALMPTRVRAVALIDGGLWSPAQLGPRDEVRARLTPPPLGIPADRLWELIRQGELGTGWSDERRDALAPTFVADEQGLLRTRIGIDRHLRVLDGLLDLDVNADLDACEAAGVPVWAAVCEPAGPIPPDAWQAVRQEGTAAAERRPNMRVHRWPGAIHDVPLQWPALVAGFVDALVETEECR
jgi:pimeloyl-ACP methyl ester carboxylesterase